LCSLYKNGSQLFTGANIGTASTASVSSLVYLNGSTDYIELYGYPVNAATTISGISTTWLNGALVRAA
jgi:hypothetical protein